MHRIRSWARTKAYASNYNPFAVDQRRLPPNVTTSPPPNGRLNAGVAKSINRSSQYNAPTGSGQASSAAGAAASAQTAPAAGAVAGDGGVDEHATLEPTEKQSAAKRFYHHAKTVLLYSWINVLLIFVPIGLVIGAMYKKDDKSISPGLVFAMNAIAIVPLAGMLSHATESVASKMGDTVGAFLNVTFGNAVELIIFIALVQKEVTLVQASLAGSILANLLLILGMCFLFGGLRYREQIYNSTVTQMSACLLSLSVMSLLLPTAFHASFTKLADANRVVLQVSRGTSVVLLLVYILYLLFQLKSHAYMYEGTPQSVIDEESHPGVLADMFSSSSSSESSSESSDSDSDSSSGSRSTAKRIKRVLKGRRHRKSSTSSKDTRETRDTHSMSTSNRPISAKASNVFELEPVSRGADLNAANQYPSVFSGDEADTDGERDANCHGEHDGTVITRDFGTEMQTTNNQSQSLHGKKSHKRQSHKHRNKKVTEALDEKVAEPSKQPDVEEAPLPHVGFADETTEPNPGSKRPFNLKSLSVRPALPKMLSQTVFSSNNTSSAVRPAPQMPQQGRVRRTSSLPGRLNQSYLTYTTMPGLVRPIGIPGNPHGNDDDEDMVQKPDMSRTAAIMLLLISTALVAVCAEFLVDSIDDLVSTTHISETFIGLILLPIVGNAAEHVTAVTVASKNKMDLAIGVAVGSSIQIALFVTPLIVLLGWILNVAMSLYFSLFQVAALFASVFVVNFLVLDGRSNYLEGALLCAAYVIIAVSAYFYPACADQSDAGGNC